MNGLVGIANQIGSNAKLAVEALQNLSSDEKNNFLLETIKEIDGCRDQILTANNLDIADAEKTNKDKAFIDRLMLNQDRISGMVKGLEELIKLPDPIGQTLDSWDRPNGLKISRVSTPLGVIGIIFESRPNVACDASALCLKSGNAVILRSGSDGLRSSIAIVDCFQSALKRLNLPHGAIQIMPKKDRELATLMLQGLDGSIDVIAPRGGKSLVAEVQKSAKVPVFGHLEGICHVFIDKDADLDKALEVSMNSKMRRTGICGAAETILIHKDIAVLFGPKLISSLTDQNCEVRGCNQTQDLDPRVKIASEKDWKTEYLAPIISIRIVDDVHAAISHIQEHGTNHTESILSENKETQAIFSKKIDSAIIMVNASTQFADGGEFGFGGEIGIATGKFHARGPVGINQLTSFKYVVEGTGQTRP